MPRTVMVLVEDDPMNRLLAVDALERAGYEVADFSRADDAVSYVERMPESIAGLLADINVPGERDGIDLAQTFADRWPDKAVILTSGLFGPGRPSDMPDGADFIAKPWTAKALIARMAEVFGPNQHASETDA
jgi:CheY-like chemotaxis protein